MLDTHKQGKLAGGFKKVMFQSSPFGLQNQHLTKLHFGQVRAGEDSVNQHGVLQQLRHEVENLEQMFRLEREKTKDGKYFCKNSDTVQMQGPSEMLKSEQILKF